MPKHVENKLRKEGKSKGLKGKALDAYVYGTMNRLGLLKDSKKKGSKKK